MKWIAIVCLVVVMAAGCQQNPPQRLNSPPQGQSGNGSAMQAHFERMTDSALMSDMSVADIHFAGTSAELSGTGLVRMERMAKILKTYGGDLHYSTAIVDQNLVQARLSRLEAYLSEAGVDMDKVTVSRGLPASEGMTAAEAVEAQKAPTAKDERGSGGVGRGSSGGSRGAGK